MHDNLAALHQETGRPILKSKVVWFWTVGGYCKYLPTLIILHVCPSARLSYSQTRWLAKLVRSLSGDGLAKIVCSLSGDEARSVAK